MDESRNLLYVNREAVDILVYPENARTLQPFDRQLSKKIQSVVPKNLSSFRSSSVSELVSGKRRYICRTFCLDSATKDPAVGRTFALILERPNRVLRIRLGAAQQFGLTGREIQTIEFLAQGLTSKEIASRMKISPYTVKAYIRQIMFKTDTSTRSGIVGTILNDLLS